MSGALPKNISLARQSRLTAEEARRLFHYDPETGLFSQKAERLRIKPGRKIGHETTDGYIRIKFKRREFLAHRLAWLHVYGEWPKGFLDHRNGVRTDNRIANLRIATAAQNLANSPWKNPLRGAYRDKKTGRWLACIMVQRRQIRLGMFDTAEEAHAAYVAAAKIHFGSEFVRAP